MVKNTYSACNTLYCLWEKKGAGTLRRIFDVESFECLKHQSARTDKRAITTADLMDEEEHTTDTFDDVVEKTEEKSNEDSTFAAESDNADESAETTPNDDTSDREIQCAACGNISKQRNWFLSRIGTHYVICPKCGTLRYVCHNNAGYRKE